MLFENNKKISLVRFLLQFLGKLNFFFFKEEGDQEAVIEG